MEETETETETQEQTRALVATDALGRVIRPGMVITYPGRSGSSMWMNIAIVRGMHEEPGRWGITTDLVLEVERLTKNRDYSEADSGFGPYYVAHKMSRTKYPNLATITGMTENEATGAVMRGKGWY